MSYHEVRERVAAAAGRSGRSPESVTIVAVGKTRTPNEIMDLYRAGHRDFGESRAQELADKAAGLPKDIRWHFVGHLQSNKARLVRPVVSLLHSMDRVSLASVWLKGKERPPPVLLQVNLGAEQQKAGLVPGAVGRALVEMASMGVEVKGLMAIPPAPGVPEDSRPHFETLRSMLTELSRDHPALTELSMGMTDDYEVAVEEGASFIRIGRAIFGPRN